MEKKPYENKKVKEEALVAKKDFQCTYGSGQLLKLKKGDIISPKLPEGIITNLKTEGVL
jgi:hypothetical protein